jgi:hypothetical protein
VVIHLQQLGTQRGAFRLGYLCQEVLDPWL